MTVFMEISSEGVARKCAADGRAGMDLPQQGMEMGSSSARLPW
jgi:hypothetical protein